MERSDSLFSQAALYAPMVTATFPQSKSLSASEVLRCIPAICFTVTVTASRRFPQRLPARSAPRANLAKLREAEVELRSGNVTTEGMAEADAQCHEMIAKIAQQVARK